MSKLFAYTDKSKLDAWYKTEIRYPYIIPTLYGKEKVPDKLKSLKRYVSSLRTNIKQMIYLLLYYLLNEIQAATKNVRQIRNQIK